MNMIADEVSQDCHSPLTSKEVIFFAQKDMISQSPSSVACRDVLLVATAYEGYTKWPRQQLWCLKGKKKEIL